MTNSSYSLNDLSGVDAIDPSEDEAQGDGKEGFAHADLQYASVGDIDTMTSAAIDFTGASYPVAMFYAVGKKAKYNPTLAVGVTDEDGTSELLKFVPAEDQEENEAVWKRYILPLETATGKEMSFYFTTAVPEDAEDSEYESIGVDKLVIADYPGVTEISYTVNDGSVEMSWIAPENSFGVSPDSYDVIIDGQDPLNVSDTEYSFEIPEESTKATTTLKVSLRANYDDVAGKYSPEFDVIVGESGVNAITIIDGMAATVEYLDINGFAVKNPVKGSTIIRRIITKDGNIIINKMIAK